MKCSFAEKVSAMIDGELPEAEAAEIRMHLSECSDCRDMERDFLLFREQLRGAARDVAADRTNAPVAKRPSFWTKGISVPVPVFAGLFLIVIGLGIGLIVWRSGETGKIAVKNPPSRDKPTKSDKVGELSISRFDTGGRAAIYVAQRQETR